MKIEELRIGSILTYNGVNVKVEVINNEIGEVYVWGDDFYYNVELENLKPIPLTEEWLLKFGFKLDFPFYRNDTFQTKKDNDGFLVYQFSDFLRRVYYVHQLQNLYFALTGKELCEAK